MSVTHRRNRKRTQRVLAASLVIAAGVWPSFPALAASLTYYARGQAYTIERSETELGLELLPGDTIAAAEARFRALGLGTVARLPWGPTQGRFAILRTAQADADTQARVRVEGLVKSVRRLYRFGPAGLPHLGTGRVVVQFAAAVPPEVFGDVVAEHGARLVRAVGPAPRTYVVEPRDNGVDEVELAARLHQDSRTAYAHPDLMSPLMKTQYNGSTPSANSLGDDPYSELQWHLVNTGQEGGVEGADINILGAWSKNSGSGVVVGMLDDACDVMHEDLVSNYINASHDAGAGTISRLAANPSSSSERHGTAMMGLICAARNNLKGVVGVAPEARFTFSRGADAGLSASEIAGAFDFAIERNVDVHCDGWAGESGAPSADAVREAVEEAFTSGRNGMGMIVVFPTGNGGEELAADVALAGLTSEDGKKLVIGVGACNAEDRVASYSGYGIGVVDVLAPSGDVFLPQVVTTDNTDDAGFDAPGYNHGGMDDFGLPNLSDPQYTRGDSFSDMSEKDFFGTSAACAQVAGVAALVLAKARQEGVEITPTQVRAILQHTAKQIPVSNPEQGDYNAITGRSLKYGYGRVDAAAALAQADLVTSSVPYTWPERVMNVTVSDSETEGKRVLRWEKNDDLRPVQVPVPDGEPDQMQTVMRGDQTTSVLVVQRIGLDFEWVPADGTNYSVGSPVDPIQNENVTVTQVGNNTSYEFSPSLGLIYFGIFARNAAGRFSFGISINSDGEVFEVGRSTRTGMGNANDNLNANTGGTTQPVGPTVSFYVAPLSGVSPLTVSFRGNAPDSDSPIVSASWDFGDGSPPTRQAVAEHTYTITGTATRTFTATFTVTDADGDIGQRSVVITVLPSEGAEEDPSEGAVRIIIREPGKASDIGNVTTVGARLELSVDTSRVVGTPQSIRWNLGDGAAAESFIVSHTYTQVGTLPVIADVDTLTSSANTLTFRATRLLTVLDGGNGNGNTNGNANSPQPPSGGGSGGALCGAGAAIPLIAMLGLVVLRRLRLVTA